MTFSNLFSNLFQAKDAFISNSHDKIAHLEQMIADLRDSITKTEIEKANLGQSQQAAISALEQARLAMATLAQFGGEGIAEFKAEMTAVLEADYTEVETVEPIAYLSASVEPQEVPVNEDEPTPPPASDDTLNVILEAVQEQPQVEETSTPIVETEEVIAEKQQEEEAKPTIDQINKMPRIEVIDWLDKLGVEYDKKSLIKDLRAKLTVRLTFINIEQREGKE